jgi:hypothetical protein
LFANVVNLFEITGTAFFLLVKFVQYGSRLFKACGVQREQDDF